MQSHHSNQIVLKSIGKQPMLFCHFEQKNQGAKKHKMHSFVYFSQTFFLADLRY